MMYPADDVSAWNPTIPWNSIQFSNIFPTRIFCSSLALNHSHSQWKLVIIKSIINPFCLLSDHEHILLDPLIFKRSKCSFKVSWVKNVLDAHLPLRMLVGKYYGENSWPVSKLNVVCFCILWFTYHGHHGNAISKFTCKLRCSTGALIEADIYKLTLTSKADVIHCISYVFPYIKSNNCFPVHLNLIFFSDLDS